MIAIVYATRRAGTRRIVDALVRHFPEGTIAHDLADGAPDLVGAETVVLGTGIYVGRALKSMRKYVAGFDPGGRRVAVFVSGLEDDPAKQQEELDMAFPEDAVGPIVARAFLPGRLHMDSLNPLERFTMSKVKNATTDIDAFDADAIEAFARKVIA